MARAVALRTSPIMSGRAPVLFVALALVATSAIFSFGAMRSYPLPFLVPLSATPLLALAGPLAVRAYGVNPWLAAFGTITLLQVGHLGEHTTQILQLTFTGGDLMRSHGVFGQLDFETVHFFWDSSVWAGTLILLWRFGRQNGWLWVSLLFASLHEIEHIYLYTVYLTEPHFYMHGGGFAGILGKGGMLPTVERPYLHFGYNFMVVVPMVIAFWEQLRSQEGNQAGRSDA